MSLIPQSLPNGLTLPKRYRTLLEYFTTEVLASLSSHPSIHEDLCKGLVPAMLESPHLLSASLCLSASGFLWRGRNEVDGIDILRVMEHLQSSGLSLLRTALERGQKDETLLATCLIWCLADVFAGQQGVASWRIHLQGIKAILGGTQVFAHFVKQPGHAQSAMRHLYQLYLSLQTLPYVSPASPEHETAVGTAILPPLNQRLSPLDPKIDGFLGYSEELLDINQQINHIADREGGELETYHEADILLGKVKGMITRDTETPPAIEISSPLSPESGRDFVLCHKTFQQATLINLYRRLYNLPSGSDLIQTAVEEIKEMVNHMTQGQPCNTWVAMSMPLFTIGCEAFTDEQKEFVLDKVHKLETCIGSLHVRVIRQALEDIWRLRAEWNDVDGDLCASQLMSKLNSKARVKLRLMICRGIAIQYYSVLMIPRAGLPFTMR